MASRVAMQDMHTSFVPNYAQMVGREWAPAINERTRCVRTVHFCMRHLSARGCQALTWSRCDQNTRSMPPRRLYMISVLAQSRARCERWPRISQEIQTTKNGYFWSLTWDLTNHIYQSLQSLLQQEPLLDFNLTLVIIKPFDISVAPSWNHHCDCLGLPPGPQGLLSK